MKATKYKKRVVISTSEPQTIAQKLKVLELLKNRELAVNLIETTEFENYEENPILSEA